MKASEPAFTAFIAAVFQSSYLNLNAYLSLLMVIIGVAISSANEMTFSFYCLGAGLVSNIFASARGVAGKAAMSNEEKLNITLSPESLYSIITIMSSFILIPLMLIMEGGSIIKIFSKMTKENTEGLTNAIISGKTLLLTVSIMYLHYLVLTL